MTHNSHKISYYDILKTTRDANDEEIKKAYLRLAKKYHPDQNPGNIAAATRRFHKIVEAYNTLRTSEKRALYNRTLNSDKAYNANDNTIFTRFGSWIWDKQKTKKQTTP